MGVGFVGRKTILPAKKYVCVSIKKLFLRNTFCVLVEAEA